jgi:hypothetical protein
VPICIYCLRELPTHAFNKEHVVPRQLGAFENSPTLIEQVCLDCNRLFGNTIELAFGRDSIEAVYRLRHGQKRPNDFDGFKGNRLSFKIPAHLPGGGIVLEPRPSTSGDDIEMMLPPQVGVQVPGKRDWRYFTEEDLSSDNREDFPLPDAKVNLRVVAADDAGVDRMRELVRKHFPKFREEGALDLPRPELVEGKALIEIKSTVDRLLARAVAKISFNYMALHAGAEFARNRNFDAIRRFIRFDEGPDEWHQFVRFLQAPLFAEETDDLKVTQGHVLILGWKDVRTLTVTFSPYNALAYEVVLTNTYSGIWLPLKVGHVFDWDHHEVIRLTPNERILLPLGWANRAARAYRAYVRRPPP